MMLARDVIDLLRHTSSSCIVGCLVFVVVNRRIENDLLGYMDGAYLRFIDVSYDVLLEAYLLDVLVHAFGIWIGYILGHVVGELMR